MTKVRRYIFAIALVGAGLPVPNEFGESPWLRGGLYADIPSKFGLSAWQTSMSGAGSARLNDASATYFNPAGLTAPGSIAVAQKSHELLSGFGFQKPQMSINTTNASALAKHNAGIGQNIRTFTLMNVGFAFDLRSFFRIYKDIPVRLGIMAALVGPGSSGEAQDIASVTEESGKFYSFRGMGREAVKPNVAAALSVQPLPYLSVGVGMNVSAGVTGTLYMHKMYTDTRPPISETYLDVKLRPSLLAGVQFSMPLKRYQRISAGLSYRQENFLPADVNVDVMLPKIDLFTLRHQTALQIMTFYEPHTVTLGLGYAWRIYSLYLDAEYQAWSQFSRGKTRYLLEGLPNFKDAFAIKSGFAIDFPWYEIKARTGYGFISAFTPDQTGITNYLDNDKHILSIGVGKFFQKLPESLAPDSLSVNIELSFQWQYWKERKTVKTIQDPLADGTFQPNYFYGGNLYIFQLTITAYL